MPKQSPITKKQHVTRCAYNYRYLHLEIAAPRPFSMGDGSQRRTTDGSQRRDVCGFSTPSLPSFFQFLHQQLTARKVFPSPLKAVLFLWQIFVRH